MLLNLRRCAFKLECTALKCSNVELWLGEPAAHVGNVCGSMINDGAALLTSQNEAYLLSVIKRRRATSKTAAAETSDTSRQSLRGEGRVNGCRGRAKGRVEGGGVGEWAGRAAALYIPLSLQAAE